MTLTRRRRQARGCLNWRGQRFEIPSAPLVVGANRPGFATPTIRRQFSALARRPVVCGAYSAVTMGLGRRTRKSISDAEFWVPDCAASNQHAGAISSWDSGLGEVPTRSRTVRTAISASAGALSPNADHWSGREVHQSAPYPESRRGSRPSIAALTRAGQRKASEMVRADPTLGFAFARGEQLDDSSGLVVGLPPAAMAYRENRPSVDERAPAAVAHRAHGASSFALALNDLAASVGDGGVQGMIRTRF